MNRIITLFGGVGALAAALGVVPNAVSNWRRRGIPDARKWQLLVLARERGLDLAPEDLGLPPQPGDDRPARAAQDERAAA